MGEATAENVRVRIRDVVEEAEVQRATVTRLLTMVPSQCWQAAEPEALGRDVESTGDARGYLSAYDFGVEL